MWSAVDPADHDLTMTLPRPDHGLTTALDAVRTVVQISLRSVRLSLTTAPLEASA